MTLQNTVQKAACAMLAVAVLLLPGAARADEADRFRAAWPETDFSRSIIDLSEVMSGGPPRDGIPSIDNPVFEPVAGSDLPDNMPVLSLEYRGETRAYPLSILMWHEIVNDEFGGEPVAITYCPLCNSGAAFLARIEGVAYKFGTSGLLRHSDMIMYDRQTDSWWQQFLGEGIVGEMAGESLEWLPVRMESIGAFAARNPAGEVLVPNDDRARSYGQNPYVRYDSNNWPFLYRGDFDADVEPLSRVVAVGDQAWALELVREAGHIEVGDLVITWTGGQASALDARDISRGADVGNVVVQRQAGDALEDVVYMVPFAFAFHAFHPGGTIHTELE